MSSEQFDIFFRPKLDVTGLVFRATLAGPLMVAGFVLRTGGYVTTRWKRFLSGGRKTISYAEYLAGAKLEEIQLEEGVAPSVVDDGRAIGPDRYGPKIFIRD